MPVRTRQFNGHRVVVSNPGTECFEKHDQQRHYPAGHVQRMQSKNNIQELACTRSVEIDTPVPHLVESNQLHSDKCNAKNRSNSDQLPVLLHPSLLEHPQGQLHGDAADQNYRGTVIKQSWYLNSRPFRLGTLYKICAGQASEHHDDAAQAYPKRELVGMNLFSLRTHGCG